MLFFVQEFIKFIIKSTNYMIINRELLCFNNPQIYSYIKLINTKYCKRFCMGLQSGTNNFFELDNSR